jgi:hypothetical protein
MRSLTHVHDHNDNDTTTTVSITLQYQSVTVPKCRDKKLNLLKRLLNIQKPPHKTHNQITTLTKQLSPQQAQKLITTLNKLLQ